MIQFRCWFCNRAFLEAPELAGQRFRCSCARLVKVPKRPGGWSKSRSLEDWVVETLVYGGLCATFAFALSFAVITRAALFRANFTPLIVATMTGLIAGALFGERALNYFGRKFRDRYKR
jgi:hypothetical protein